MSAGATKPRKAPARNRTGLPGNVGLVSHAGHTPMRRRPLYIKIRGILTCGSGSVSRKSLRPVMGRASLCGHRILHKEGIFTPETAVLRRKIMLCGVFPQIPLVGVGPAGCPGPKGPAAGAYPSVRQGRQIYHNGGIIYAGRRPPQMPPAGIEPAGLPGR